MRRRTSRTWWINRRFRHFDRPMTLTWAKADKSLAYLTATLGPWHPDTVSARRTMQTWRMNDGHTAGAVRMAQSEVAARTGEFGPDHTDTLAARRTLAWRRSVVGDMDGAVAEARLLVEDLTQMYSPDHEDTHDARRTLAEYLCENGDAPEGIRRLTALCAESQALGPRRYEATRHVRTSLIRALERNGDYQEALDLLDEEIAVERNTIYGVDENLNDLLLQEWRARLATNVGRSPPTMMPTSQDGQAGGEQDYA